MNPQELQGLYESYLEVYNEGHQLDEAEGSYGQTPKARTAYGALANKRRATPAGGFAKRGEKTTKVKSAQKHFDRTGNPDAGNRGKKSTKPSFSSGKRSGMTQSDRDDARGEAEYGHTGYDPDYDGPPSAPGGKPKGKKLERQKKTGVSAESYDLYDIILSHLLDEGYADTEEAAEAIMVSMSEEWRQSIVEGGFPQVRLYNRAGDAGAEQLKLIRTRDGGTGYRNKHTSGEQLPSGTVNAIMSGDLMVRNPTNSRTKTA